MVFTYFVNVVNVHETFKSVMCQRSKTCFSATAVAENDISGCRERIHLVDLLLDSASKIERDMRAQLQQKKLKKLKVFIIKKKYFIIKKKYFHHLKKIFRFRWTVQMLKLKLREMKVSENDIGGCRERIHLIDLLVKIFSREKFKKVELN